MKLFSQIVAAAAFACGVIPSQAMANQSPVDQADPSVVEDELRDEKRERPDGRPLQAPKPRPARSSPNTPILVGAVRVEGAQALPQAAFAPVIESYAGRTLSPGELQALASDIANVARRAGFGLATAWIPQQRVEHGVLKVLVDEGRIDAVEVTGSGRDAAERYVRRLGAPGPVRTAELERQLLLAGDAAGVEMGKARLERRDGRNVLVVAASQDRIQGRAILDNWGSSTSGPIRARLSFDVNGVFGPDDRLSVDGLVTPVQPKEFGLLRAVYGAPIDSSGTEISIGGYVAASEAGGALVRRDIDGRSIEAEAELRHPLLRSRQASVWAALTVRVRDSEQSREDAPIRDDRLATLTGSLYGVRRLPDGRLRGRASLVQGFGGFGATQHGDPLASRPDADGRFTKIELWAEVEHKLGGRFSLFAQAEGQAANGPLLSSEEMGLGGRFFGRAWDYREFSGDRGLAGALELRFDLKPRQGPIKSTQLYVYADAGTVANEGAGTGGGSLASSGVGIRFRLPKGLRAGLEVGVPLTHGADPTKDDEPRFSFTIDKRF
jgi:hemolysin activation/secretion protein